jgi:DNA-binding transcriptional regulator YiaG
MPMRGQSAPLRVTTPPPDAAHVIRTWRRRLGLTQEGLARALSVTFSTVSRWENGHVLPSKLAWRALQELAATHGCPLEVDEGDGRT